MPAKYPGPSGLSSSPPCRPVARRFKEIADSAIGLYRHAVPAQIGELRTRIGELLAEQARPDYWLEPLLVVGRSVCSASATPTSRFREMSRARACFVGLDRCIEQMLMVAATAIEGCTGKDDPVECCQIEPGSAEAIASYCGKSCYQVLQAAWISRVDLQTSFPSKSIAVSCSRCGCLLDRNKAHVTYSIADAEIAHEVGEFIRRVPDEMTPAVLCNARERVGEAIKVSDEVARRRGLARVHRASRTGRRCASRPRPLRPVRAADRSAPAAPPQRRPRSAYRWHAARSGSVLPMLAAGDRNAR